MASSVGSLKQSFIEKNRERVVLPRKEYSHVGFGESQYVRHRGCLSQIFRSIQERFCELCSSIRDAAIKAYQMGHSDPRKAVFAAKMGLALSLVSVLIFFKEPLSYIGQYSIWAILTVVVVFEFSIGKSYVHYSNSMPQIKSHSEF